MATYTTYKTIIKQVKLIAKSSSSSSAAHCWTKPLQLLAISLDLQLLASSSCHPSCTNHHSTWPEGFLHYVYRDTVSTPELVYPNCCRFYS
jgi:hypothetical protein